MNWTPIRRSTERITLHGEQVPLAGNFTAAYGLWLAQSGFARQSLRTLFGMSEGIGEPHIYLMQPWDPNRRIIFMLHGLASSPEAWVNLANDHGRPRAAPAVPGVRSTTRPMHRSR